jgi:hypothetical protein
MKAPPADPEPLQQEPPKALRRAQEERLLKTWETPMGWRYWSAVNNTEVGLGTPPPPFYFSSLGAFWRF